jgi:hypothetical protein
MASVPVIQRCSSCERALAFYFENRRMHGGIIYRIRRGEFNVKDNFTSLEKSAVEGCDLCRILYQALIYEEPAGADLNNSTEPVRLSSNGFSLTIHLHFMDSQGSRILVSNILWSEVPEARPIGGTELQLWNPSARITSALDLQYLIS